MAEPFDLAGLKAKAEQATPGPWTNGMRGSGSNSDAHMCRVVARRPATQDKVAHGLNIAATWHPEAVVSYVGLSRQQCVDNAEHIAACSPDRVLALHAALFRFRQALVDNVAVCGHYLANEPDAPWTQLADIHARLMLEAFDQEVRL